MNILTDASTAYMHAFQGFTQQFFKWGQLLFFSLVTINIVWLCLWNAFDRHAINDAMPSFIKQFFVIGLFYTFMMNPAWLSAALKSAEVMGSTITHSPVDPSSIISLGIGLANKILIPVQSSSILFGGPGMIIAFGTYIVIVFCFLSIALDLAVTLIITTALISMSAFFLGFAALGATAKIAHHTLEVIFANCVKLLGIYAVVSVGSKTIHSLPTPQEFIAFDPYLWIIAVVVLFWLVAKNLPSQLAKMVTFVAQDNQGTSAAAIATSVVHYAKMAFPPVNAASTLLAGSAKVLGSTAQNAAAHFANKTKTSGNPALGLMAAAGGSLKQLGQSTLETASQHGKHVADKLAGGPGLKTKTGSGKDIPLPTISERIYRATNQMQDLSETKK